jgi:hypothetical protein
MKIIQSRFAQVRVQTVCLCRCGRYVVPQSAYSYRTVGRQALKSRWIQERLGDQLHVQPAATAAIPFGTLHVLMSQHHENIPANAIVTHRMKSIGRLDPVFQRLEWASELKKCRCAAHALSAHHLSRRLQQCLFQLTTCTVLL